MGEGPPKTKWARGVPVNERPRQWTRLREWMEEQQLSCYALAKGMGCNQKTLSYWMLGQALPPLVWAFKMEKYTEGAVPASSWLATDIAGVRWRTEGTEATR